MQGKTYSQEKEAGILFSRKIDQGGHLQHSWERMREVKTGDIILHYVNGRIVAVSSAASDCTEHEMAAGLPQDENSNPDAYIVKLEYHELNVSLPIADHLDVIAPLLPVKYSAFQANGLGNQGYMYPCNDELAIQLLELIGEANFFLTEDEQLSLAIDSVERNNEDPLVPLTMSAESKIKTKLRVGKNKFCAEVENVWNHVCPICGISLKDALRACYAKPWKDSSNEERLNPFNGLLLCCNHYALYHNGYISFDQHGKILISKALDEKENEKFLLDTDISIPIADEHKPFLKWHKKYRFKA
jgi:hypothetical protein